MKVPVDEGIADLVEELAALDGVYTTASCAGHHDGDDANVLFFCQNRESLIKIVRATPLSFTEVRKDIAITMWDYARIHIDVDGSEIRYHLWFSANKLDTLRARITEMVENLRKSGGAL